MSTALTVSVLSAQGNGFIPQGSPSFVYDTTVIVGWHPSAVCSAFFRFPLAVPRGATITNAFLRLGSVMAVPQGTCNLSMSCLATDNAPQPAATAEVTGATHTDLVQWPAVPTVEHNVTFDSPDIAQALQAIVSRDGWVSGNYVILHVQDAGSTEAGAYRPVYGYNEDGDPVPELHVTFDDTAPSKTSKYYSKDKWGIGLYEQVNPTLFFPDSCYVGYGNVGANAPDGFYHYTSLVHIPLYVPQGAQIDSAVLRLISIGDFPDTGVNLSVKLVDQADVAPLKDPNTAGSFKTKADIEALPKTAAIAWNNVPTLTHLESIDSPNLAALVQGIVNKSDWKTGNSILVVIEDNGSTQGVFRVFLGFQNLDDPQNGSSLLVEHTPANNDTFAAAELMLPMISSAGSWSASVFPSLGYLPSQVLNLLSPAHTASGIDDSVSAYALENADFYGNPTLGDYWAWCCLMAVGRDIRYSAEYGDAWTCAARTLERAWGDCEDGAILLHSMMLSLGCPASRIKTVFGTYGMDSIGHAWTIFLRASDGEWVVMDWTAYDVSPPDIEDLPRQLDVLSTYKDVSKVLTRDAFVATTQAQFVASITNNHAVGLASLPIPAGSAASGPHASGVATLSKMTGDGRCGARASASLPAVTGTGTAQQLATAWGSAMLAVMAGDGTTGATAAGVLAAFTGTGQCGTSASGKANFPAIAGTGTATTAALVHGVGVLPLLASAGVALSGATATGAGVIPTLDSLGLAAQGPTANGVAILPQLSGKGLASMLLAAVAASELPPFVGQGHAIGAAPWVRTLKYDPARWA
uniref:Transglutaminase-like superfamily protein n=1 Tax=Desulfovibrio sp. U5L TaxID=596152 RepID=I2Q022_9BACT